MAADALGASVDELKLIASFLLSYPLAGLLKRVPDSKPWLKNVFIIAVSLFYLVGLFDLWDGIRTILYSAAGTYAIAHYIDGTFMPWIVFVFLMGHMSINHIERQFLNDPSRIDITGAQMVMVMKLSGFAWNVHDGRIRDEYLNGHQKERAIRQMPGFLDYAGYVLFFPRSWLAQLSSTMSTKAGLRPLCSLVTTQHPQLQPKPVHAERSLARAPRLPGKQLVVSSGFLPS